VTDSFAANALAWLLTYAVHSTVLLGMAWIVLRLRRADPATSEVLWKVAMIGALVTASVQTALEIRPAGTVALRPAAQQQAPTSLVNDQLVSPSTHTETSTEYENGNTNSNSNSNTNNDNALTPNTPATAAPARTLSSTALLVGGWLLAALLLVLWYVGRRLILVGRLGDRRVVHEGELATLLNDLRRDAGVSRKIVLTASQTISSPVALGRSEICLPAAAMSELDPEQQRAMLAHELAHLVRRDPQWLAFACLMERAFFFQPLNRLARRGMQQSAEYLADEWAAQRSGGVPLARCLVKVAEWIQASPLGVPVAGMAEERSQLAARVSRLLEQSPLGGRRSRAPLAFLSTGALVAMVMFAPGVSGRAASPEGNPLDILGGFTASEVDASLDETDGVDPNDKGDKGEKGDKGTKDETFNDSPEMNVADIDGAMAALEQFNGNAVREDTAVVRALIARLRDEDAEVRQAAAHALGRIGDRMAITPLVNTLDDPEIEVVSAALDALGNFDRGVPAAPVRRLLSSSNADIRHSALHILGHLKDRESIAAIARLVSDQDANVRQTAIQALSEIGDPSSAAAIAGAISDVDADVRESALEALSELGGTIPEGAVQRALRDVDADVRDAAIHLVEERRLVSMVPELVRMLDDTSAEIRECAAEALTEMRTEQSHAALKTAMNHRDPAVRRVAVEYFGEESDK
jgi:HEAT repeat protein/beta-lactamase regulating signal transducer with metallopeptidase domain